MPFSAYLLPVYAVGTLFPRLLNFPAPLGQVQVTELLFPLLLWVFWRDLGALLRAYPRFTLAGALYLVANLASAAWAGHAGAMLEAGARVYLLVLTYIVVAHGQRYGMDAVVRVWTWATVAVAGGCSLLYLLIAAQVLPNYWGAVSYFPDYPYFGAAYRLRGPAQTYGMLYMLLLPGLLLAYRDWRSQSGAAWPAALIALAGLLTLGKENLLFPIGVLLFEAARATAPDYRTAMRLAADGLAILLLLGTHLLLVRTDSTVLDTAFTSGRSVGGVGDYTVVETNYTANKRAALEVGLQHPLLGVGPGRFAQATVVLADSGRYPAHFGRFDPHSAWTGAFAETGLLGLAGLLALVLVVFGYRPALPWSAVTVLLLLFLLSSVFKDVMNFRGLWVVVGMYVGESKRTAH